MRQHVYNCKRLLLFLIRGKVQKFKKLKLFKNYNFLNIYYKITFDKYLNWHNFNYCDFSLEAEAAEAEAEKDFKLLFKGEGHVGSKTFIK